MCNSTRLLMVQALAILGGPNLYIAGDGVVIEGLVNIQKEVQWAAAAC